MGAPRSTSLLVALALAAGACGGDDADVTAGSAAPLDPATSAATTDSAEVTATDASTITSTTTTSTASTTVTTTTAPTTTTTTPTTTTTTSTTTTPTTTTTTTTAVPTPVGPVAVLDLDQDLVGLGYSVEGRPIFAERYGTPGGRRVLVIGVIHGNEDDGVAILDRLRTRPVPDGVELWLVESMNPDGQARQDRQNANEVDLNRNFPHNWGPIGEPGFGQYAGTGPASEPETQVMVNFITELRPDITLWYHQDANLIIPSTGREGRVRARYAELTGLPLADCCDGGIYTGIAATWARNALADAGAVAFIVELPGELPDADAEVHADAVLAIAAEG